MKKKISLVFILGLSLLMTGCLKRDTLEDVDIYTTYYPLEYITERLYGNHSTIYSIYPNGVINEEYILTEKQIKDYSSASIFIFNGVSDEKDYILPMYNYNKNIKIIDANLSMEYTYSIEELWLDPSNFLMMAQNIKNGFNDYITSHYLNNEIEENYEELKTEISNLDAKLTMLADKSTNKTLVVSNDLFKFLEKYGFEIISLEENDNLTTKIIENVKTMINNGEISYIYLKQNEDISSTIQSIIDSTGVETLTIHSISNLDDEEKANYDYISLMNSNIELLKKELYD
ncbi:MAG: metal ABC transporter substrate-binding protein [Bacilli bacterium]|nr:metal ABC transporter substrate-binding protein [Bacilli bacterium]